MTRDQLRSVVTQQLAARPITPDTVDRIMTACDEYASLIALQASEVAVIQQAQAEARRATPSPVNPAPAVSRRNNGPVRTARTPRRTS